MSRHYEYKDMEDWKRTSDYGCPISEINNLRRSNKFASDKLQKLRHNNEELKEFFNGVLNIIKHKETFNNVYDLQAKTRRQLKQ